MVDQMLEKAVEDVQLIKNVMDRTNDTLNLMNRVFMSWGVAFTAIGAASNLLYLFGPGFLGIPALTPFLAVIPRLAIGVSAVWIFLMFQKGMQDKGLNRQFMILWLAVFLCDVVFPTVNFLLRWSIQGQRFAQLNIYPYFVPGISLIMLSLGMFCMSVFTRVKPFGWLALAGLLLYLTTKCISGTYAGGYITVLLSSLISPLSLLYVGIILKKRSQRKVAINL